MTQPTIRRLTTDQFVSLLVSVLPTLTRTIDSVHLHHTWRPTQAQFRGKASIEAMRAYHLGLTWDDVAQHLTIDPSGFSWTGRNWNLPPASQKGRNGSAAAGPFMIEMVGDFDAGQDVLQGAQRSAVCDVVAALLHARGLTTADVHFHRELGSPKSCPGTGVDKAVLLAEIDARLVALGPAVSTKSATGKAARHGKAAPVAAALPLPLEYLASRDVAIPATVSADYQQWGIAEDGVSARGLTAATASRTRDALHLAPILGRTATEWAELRPHVVNLREGRLSRGGDFEMDDRSIADIVTGIREYAEGVDTPRLMVHAHGGLVSEKSALRYAKGAYGWWRRHGVYPVYFVWESHAWEVLLSALGLGRGFGEWRDDAFEGLARKTARWQWSAMKEYARLASEPDAGDGEPGGALVFARALRAMLSSLNTPIQLHLVGHSAGAILHTHWLPTLVGNQGPTVDSLTFLAPAVRIDLFNSQVRPLVGTSVARFAQFGMDIEAERDDDLIETFGIDIYGKSLLYLVSNAFEAEPEKAGILGLEERFQEDAGLLQFLQAQRLELSHARGKPHNPATHARKHGCFDNDRPTMRSVLEIVTGLSSTVDFPVADEKCDAAASRRFAPPAAPVVGAWSGGRTGGPPQTGQTRTRRALCVGIDSYPSQPLFGCVRDAQAWSGALRTLGFDVTMVLDRDATRQRVLDALRTLITTAAPGDDLVFQYAGHGTQVDDLNGDEHDRYDEALVPIDYTSGALLLDDDLAEVYRLLPAGVVLTLFMDCCHSGTNSRFAPIDRTPPRSDERRRFLELPADVVDAHRRFRARTVTERPTTPEESLPGIVHFAACLDDQFAYESAGQGHFTGVAVAALAAAVAAGHTNEAFASSVAADVIEIGRPQTPRLMRLPDGLDGRAILAGAQPNGVAGRVPAIGDDRAMAAWCLQFFEAGAEHWRRRI